MKNENPDKKYQDRVILFIDLLGFKNAVNGSVYSDELFAKVMRAVNSLYKAERKVGPSEMVTLRV